MPMWNFGQPLDGVIQVAFIVPDIHAAMASYTKQFRIGPWFLFEHFEFDWLKYRGEPTNLDVSLAMGFSGGMMFELIQQHDDLQSVYRETLERRGYGFHHLAVALAPASYDDRLQEYLDAGATLALEGSVAVGGRAAYVDFGELLPGMIELVEMNDKVEQLFTHVRTANLGWDGSDPVRRLG